MHSRPLRCHTATALHDTNNPPPPSLRLLRRPRHARASAADWHGIAEQDHQQQRHRRRHLFGRIELRLPASVARALLRRQPEGRRGGSWDGASGGTYWTRAYPM